MTTIYLAGAEIEKATNALIENGVRNILYSYFYIAAWNKESFIRRIMEDNPHVSFFLDSGAFTYAQAVRSGGKKLPPQDKFLKQYFNFIEAYGHRLTRIAEPDFDSSTMTVDQVTEIREAMLTRWPQHNIIPVFHPWRGTDTWLEYCQDARIKGLGIGMGKYTLGELRRLVMTAHRHGKTVHGFGMTRIQSTVKVVPFDSIDSISWAMGQKYGITYLFKAGKFITLTAKNRGKERRQLYKKYYEAIGCDLKKLLADDVDEVRKSNIIAWRNLAARLEEMRKREHRNIMEPVGKAVDLGANLEEQEAAFDNLAKERIQLAPRWESRERADGSTTMGYEERGAGSLNLHKRPRERAAGEVLGGPKERETGGVRERDEAESRMPRAR